MHHQIKKHAEKLRFAVIGGINTGIDFGILFGLVALGFPTIPANIVSTSVALTFSFFANKTFTFKSSGKISPKQIGLFLGITVTGLWIIQPIIILGTHGLVASFHINSYLVLLVGKLLASVVTLVWNFVLYRKFVFKKL